MENSKKQVIRLDGPATAYSVLSSDGKRRYTVRVNNPMEIDPDYATVWECDCPAGTYGRDCKHVGLAIEASRAEDAAEDEALAIEDYRAGRIGSRRATMDTISDMLVGKIPEGFRAARDEEGGLIRVDHPTDGMIGAAAVSPVGVVVHVLAGVIRSLPPKLQHDIAADQVKRLGDCDESGRWRNAMEMTEWTHANNEGTERINA